MQIDTLIDDILSSAAKTSNRDREIKLPQCEINSITKELNNLKLNNPSCSQESTDMADLTATSSSLGPLREKGQKGFRDLISGAEIQMKAGKNNRQHAYITLQTHQQVINKEAMNYTAYLVGRERGREFKRLNEFDEQVYNYTVENKHLMIAHLSERKSKQLMNDVVVTFDPTAQILTLWFADYSGIIEISADNKPLTGNQIKYFVSAGKWGTDIQLPGRDSKSFLDCASRVGGLQ
jgi:hypothetical protein